MENINIKNILENANNIGILTKDNANDDAIGAALALFFALKSNNKNVFFPTCDISPKIESFIKTKNQKKFQISFEGEVSEVYYEKKDKGITLYLTPKDKNVGDEKFSYKIISEDKYLENQNNYDILFTLGIENFQDIEILCKESADQLYASTIINIDNNLNNQNYGEINIIKENQGISQSIACILKELEQYRNKQANSFLLYGLSFSNKKADNNKKIKTIKWLLKNGGDLNVFSKEGGISKLLEIVLKNLICKNDIYISTISSNDFKKSKTTSKDLGTITDKLKNFLNLSSFFILWESDPKIKGLIYSDKKHLIEKMTSCFDGTYKEKGGIFLIDENNLDKAKEKLLLFLN